MNKIGILNGISSAVLKNLALKQQIFKIKTVTVPCIKYCSLPVYRNKWANYYESNNFKNKQILHLPSTKYLSTSSPSLSAYKGHDHSKIWNFERILSILLLPVVPAAILSPSQQLDTILTILIVMHTHFGLEAIVVDYVRPILFGNLAPKIGVGLVYLLSIAIMAGLLNLIYNDCGLANTIINVWKN